MNHIEFIEQNIRSQLIKLGYPESVAQSSAFRGVDHYKRCSQASKKGAMFDDCFYYAKQWADKTSLPAEKPKKGRAKKSTPALF
ncbi:hypothetical protein EH228_04590 [Erwinia endophytica]|uniref:hypothetical protein n=1 Tax=Erwinia endophytica TaxID=1563158 RepID=UPI001265F699|nr:hypothetical protein [Erwinia endophytica]KAB8312959.1 hypothetical protein EH228_04590 [Erwinia endophytica]